MLLNRREMTTSVLMALPAADLTQRPQSSPSDSDNRTAEVLQDILQFLQRQADPPALGTLRAAQRIFLRANQKFPDYIEIGIGVWEQLYDWHIRTRQTLNITQLPNGRYGLQTLQTTLVLRTDADAAFIGTGSDTL
jgi:hypothetical protein